MADIEFTFAAEQIYDSENNSLFNGIYSFSCGNRTYSVQEFGVEQRIDTITLTRCDDCSN